MHLQRVNYANILMLQKHPRQLIRHPKESFRNEAFEVIEDGFRPREHDNFAWHLSQWQI